jgi:hypothetical protein
MKIDISSLKASLSRALRVARIFPALFRLDKVENLEALRPLEEHGQNRAARLADFN